MKLFEKLVQWYFSHKALPYLVVLALDCLIVLVSALIGGYLQWGGYGFAERQMVFLLTIPAAILVHLVFFYLFHTYRGIVRYSTFKDLKQVLYANLCADTSLIILSIAAGHSMWETYLTVFALATMGMWLERVMVKGLYDSFRKDENTQSVFIYGINAGGIAVAKSLQEQEPLRYVVKGFVSPEDDLVSKYLMGVLVRHDSPRLVGHMKEAGATVLIVSPLQTEHFRERQELISDLIQNHIKILIMHKAETWDGKSPLHQDQLHEVDIEDLLPRDKIDVDMEAIGNLLHGRRILITGAAGSIGSEMVRQIAPYEPEEMVLVDQAETPMHDMRLWAASSKLKVETIVGSIANKEQMEAIFKQHRPEYVFHAAAYKHVPMMEDNPAMAVQNNVYGTRVIADLAVKYGTRKFVMISTDKAVNPTNVMGCSKRICEIYCQALDAKLREESQKSKEERTQFITTRFGNVLGSNGSVIPIFREQIAKGGPVTVTHPDIIRYFMLIPEACKLVLEAGTMGKGGEIFVFDMGNPVKIVNLAKRMIALSGAQNVEIEFTGLRDGEKLYEEVLSEQENTIQTGHPKIKVAKVREYPYELARKNEEELYQISLGFDDMAIVKKMKEIVPEYKSQVSKYEQIDKELGR